MKLTIDRDKWARGGNNGAAALLNDDGNMCCLGFLAIELGLSAAQIKNVGDFSDDFGGMSGERGVVDMVNENPTQFASVCTVEWESGDYDEYEYISPTDFHSQATKINDAEVPQQDEARLGATLIQSEKKRESDLISLFGKENIELEFVN